MCVVVLSLSIFRSDYPSILKTNIVNFYEPRHMNKIKP